jgi:hypothetical protein
MSIFGGKVGDTPLASSSDCGTCSSTSCSTT